MEATTDTKKQTTLPAPGMARKTIKAVDEAASAYLSARDKRMALTKKEVQAKLDLVEVMKKHADKLPKDDKGAAIYVFEDEDGEERFAVLTASETVKVRKAPSLDEDE